MDLEHVAKWLVDHSDVLEAKQVSLQEQSYPKHETDKPSCYADLASRCRYGRIIVWVSGECEIVVLDIESGDQVHCEHRDLESEADLDQAFRALVDVIANVDNA
jgi:hypothetical protein